MLERAARRTAPDTNRMLLALWALFWLLMAVVAVEDNRHNPYIRWWEPLVWEGSSCLIATCWLLAERRVARRWSTLLSQPWRWFGKHLVWVPLIAVTFVFAVYAIRHGVYALTDETYEHPPLRLVFVYETVKLLLFYGLWLAIIFGLESFTQWRDERERLLALQKHLAESQLARLRAQLQPHFLFNSLNTISALMQVDVARADRLLTQLADLLRASLQSDAHDTTSLREELKLLELYARIMQERFAGRVTLDWRIADDALDANVPAMLLQPLLENAFKHGVERSAVPVTIRIEAARAADGLNIEVHNTGALTEAQHTTGIGIANCRARLELLYGNRASLALAADASGVTARLAMPYERHGS